LKTRKLSRAKLSGITSLLFPVLLVAGVFATPAVSNFTSSTSSTASIPSSLCFVVVPNGSTILSFNQSGATVVLPNGANVIYSQSKGNCTSTSGAMFSLSGPIEYGQDYLSSGFADVSGYWYVPKAPSNPISGEAVAFWNAVADNSGDIYQPLIAWGCQNKACTEGGTFWWMAAEDCNSTFGCVYTSTIKINYNDYMYGTLAFGGICAKGESGYVITIEDLTTGKKGTENVCSLSKQYATAGALESSPTATPLTACNQLPDQTAESFFSISTSPSVSSWGIIINPSHQTPSCGFNAISEDAADLSLYWSP
jgi:hypothetical protein